MSAGQISTEKRINEGIMTQNIDLVAESIHEAEIEIRLKEKFVERAICRQLHIGGINHERQVFLPLGIADIVDYDTKTIIEVKAILNRSSIFNAIGQLVIYVSCMGKPADWSMAIAGIDHPDIQSMKPNLERVGITVHIYEKGEVESWSK